MLTKTVQSVLGTAPGMCLKDSKMRTRCCTTTVWARTKQRARLRCRAMEKSDGEDSDDSATRKYMNQCADCLNVKCGTTAGSRVLTIDR